MPKRKGAHKGHLFFLAKNVNFDTIATLLPKVAAPKKDLQRYFTALHFCCQFF